MQKSLGRGLRQVNMSRYKCLVKRDDFQKCVKSKSTYIRHLSSATSICHDIKQPTDTGDDRLEPMSRE